MSPNPWQALITEYDDHGPHQVPYAVTTNDGLERMRRWWKKFCSQAALGTPEPALASAGASQFKAFFAWLPKNASRGPQQASTLTQYFRVLKMEYRQITGDEVSDGIVRDVNAFIKHHVSGKKPTCHRPKPVASKVDSVRLLHFLYMEDTAIYPDERQRVQQAFLILIHTYSGLRPSSTTSSSRGPSKKSLDSQDSSSSAENTPDPDLAGLRYRDVQLMLVRSEERTRFAVRSRFTRFKGGVRRAQAKTFTWWDQADVLLCPVAHLIALALYDEAFYSPSLNTVTSILDLEVPPGRQSLKVPWQNGILDKHILRAKSDVNSHAELLSSVASKRLSRLGLTMNYEDPVTWYCLRRRVLNAVDASGSDEVRNQIAGHLDSRTYRNHYQDQHIQLDVANLVMEQPTEDKLMQKLSDMSSNADPGADISLPQDAREQIEALPDVVALVAEHQKLAEKLKQQYRTISRAPTSSELFMAYDEARRAVKARKDLHRTQWRARLRREHFAQRDALLIDAQLNGEDERPKEAIPRQRKISEMPERATLARPVVDPAAITPLTQAQRVTAMQALAALCHRIERPGMSVAPRESTVAQPQPQTTQPMTADEAVPIRCHPLQCLFCLGEQQLFHIHRTKVFCRPQKLWDHVQVHINALDKHHSLPCPHPHCRAQSVVLNNVEHLLSHAQIEHGVRLLGRYVCSPDCTLDMCIYH